MVELQDCTVLVLAWTFTRGSMNVLQLIFGMIMTNSNDYLCFGCHILVHVLSNGNFSRIAITVEEKLSLMYLQYHHDIQHQEIEEIGVQCMDLNFILKKLQIFMSNGDFIVVGPMMIKSQMCLSLLLMAQFQYHFSMYMDVFMTDSQLIGYVFIKLEGFWEKYKVSCFMHSEFGKIECKFIIKSSQYYMSSNQPSRSEQLRDIHKKRAVTSASNS